MKEHLMERQQAGSDDPRTSKDLKHGAGDATTKSPETLDILPQVKV